MTLSDFVRKIKSAPDVPGDVFLVIVFLLLLFIGYVGGRLYAIDEERRGALRVLSTEGASEFTRKAGNSLTSSIYNVPVSGQYVASKNGKVFHLPWCPGAKKIKEENKIWFSSKEEALARGLTPAGNCQGI
jgi:hypothetical protein